MFSASEVINTSGLVSFSYSGSCGQRQKLADFFHASKDCNLDPLGIHSAQSSFISLACDCDFKTHAKLPALSLVPFLVADIFRNLLSSLRFSMSETM